MKITSIFLLICLSVISRGADQPSVRDRAFQFLEKSVMGRTQKISTEGTLSSEGETYLVQFEATIKWDRLEKTEEGLIFEETRNIKQTNIKTDKAGKAVGDPIKTDREVVHRYALAERATTNSLVGLTTVTKNTIEDPTGKGFITMVEMSADNKELYLYESMAGFAEASLDGKTIVPVATASEATLFLDKKGRLQTIETLKFYKVDVNKDFAREEITRFNLSASEVNP